MFIRCNAEFRNPEISEVEWDNMSDSEKRNNIQMRKMRFNPDTVQSYNEHSTLTKTTLWFKNSEAWTIDLTVDQLDKIMDGIQNNVQLFFKN